MEIVRHRLNDLAELQQLDAEFGAEIDIRSSHSQLILTHDPHASGPPFEDFLDIYARSHRDRLLILNSKEDGLEKEILRLVQRHDLQRFFFLDLTLPTTVRLALREHERRVALRVSEFEPLEAVAAFAGYADWVWVDCFEGKPLPAAQVKALHQRFKLCLVSPELQGYPVESIGPFRSLASDVDAVCTKFPASWR